MEDRSRTLNTRASSSSAAVPDSSASAGEPRASRCAITTIRRLDSPGRTPTTVSSSAVPSIVRPVSVLRLTRKPPARNSSATRSASARSASEPAGRSGTPRRVLHRVERARPVNPAGANGVVTAAGRSASEKAAMNSATTAGANAAR